ncbi:hypothetical protein ACIRSF_34110 [Streptomyces rubiginosohelvolus]
MAGCSPQSHSAPPRAGMAHPDHGGDALASCSYTQRRAVLVEVL